MSNSATCLSFTSHQKHNEWFSVRDYSFDALDFSMRREGLRRIAVVIFGMDACEVCQDEHGVEFFRGLPTLAEFADVALKNVDCFCTLAERRTIIYGQIRINMADAYGEYRRLVEKGAFNRDRSAVLRLFRRILDAYQSFLSYSYLGMIDHTIVDSFSNLLTCYMDRQERDEMFAKLLVPPDYFQLNLDNDMLARDKTTHVPYDEEYSPILGSITMDYVKYVEQYRGVIADRVEADAQNIAMDYLEIAPLLFQLGQENLFIGKSIQPLLSLLFTRLAYQLINDGYLNEPREVLTYDYKAVFERYLARKPS